MKKHEFILVSSPLFASLLLIFALITNGWLFIHEDIEKNEYDLSIDRNYGLLEMKISLDYSNDERESDIPDFSYVYKNSVILEEEEDSSDDVYMNKQMVGTFNYIGISIILLIILIFISIPLLFINNNRIEDRKPLLKPKLTKVIVLIIPIILLIILISSIILLFIFGGKLDFEGDKFMIPSYSWFISLIANIFLILPTVIFFRKAKKLQ